MTMCEHDVCLVKMAVDHREVVIKFIPQTIINIVGSVQVECSALDLHQTHLSEIKHLYQASKQVSFKRGDISFDNLAIRPLKSK